MNKERPYSPVLIRQARARLAGAAVMLLLLAAAAAFVGLSGPRWFKEPCLLLATVKDGGKLREGSPVFYRGLQAGHVAGILPPSASAPGWRLRLAVDRSAFVHISTDARVRLEPGKTGGPVVVVVLPGLEPADPDYPIAVKVLSEVSVEEDAARMAHDLLNGLADLSRAKRSEAEVIELREEVQRLQKKLAEQGTQPKNATP